METLDILFISSIMYLVKRKELKMQAIYFDMDGTIAALYNVKNWENKLRAEDTTPYIEAEPMYNMQALNSLMEHFIALGFIIGVISWSAMNGSKEYNKQVRKVKQEWIKQNLPCVTEFHCVKYNTPKHHVAKIKNSILVDDNEEVRENWEKYSENNITIDAKQDIFKQFYKLLEELC